MPGVCSIGVYGGPSVCVCSLSLSLNLSFWSGSLYSAGVKFLVVTDKRQTRMEEFFQKMYELYSDFVLKSPFYAMDMPVK